MKCIILSRQASRIRKQRLVMMPQLIPSLQPFSINLLHYFFLELLRVTKFPWLLRRPWCGRGNTLGSFSISHKQGKKDSWEPVRPCSIELESFNYSSVTTKSKLETKATKHRRSVQPPLPEPFALPYSLTHPVVFRLASVEGRAAKSHDIFQWTPPPPLPSV